MPNDFPDGTDYSKDEAQMECDAFLDSIAYVGSDQAAYCRSNLVYIRKWDDKACDDFGWTDNSTSSYSGYTTTYYGY